MPQRSRRPLLPALLAPLAAAPLLAGCGDNPSCVFTTGCQGGSGGVGSGDSAQVPLNGQTIAGAVPTILDTQPDGGKRSSTTPIILSFSESMASDTNDGKVKLVQLDVGGFPLATIPTTQALVAGGRALLILPAAPLFPADYTVQMEPDVDLLDLTGQRVALAAELVLASFSVDTEDPDEPALVATYPAEDDVAATTTPLVLVFDQPIDPASITQSSFVLEVGGAAPPFDPLPIPLTVDTGFIPIVDPRIFLWQSIDTGTGEPVSLGADLDVTLSLSPVGNPIKDGDGESLEATFILFRTQPVDPPLTAELLSEPLDAIGLKNLTAGDPEELALQVDVSAEPGDVAVVTMFGLEKDPPEGEDPILIAFERTKTATGVAPITAVSFTLADLDLATEPGVARFGDGPVAFACALRRGNATSPLRLVDVSGEEGVQDPLLDTEPPTLVELLKPGGGTAEFRSELRDLVLSGKASEQIRKAQVSTPLGDAGPVEVVGSDEDGFFIAPPLPLGLIAGGGPVDYDLTVFDAALNAAPTASGVFIQHGALDGSVPFSPGQQIEVEVVDAVTLAPLLGALVATHADQGDGVTFPLVDSDLTAADGTVSVDSAALPAAGTILTVEADGYDLWTFHGLAAGRVSVTLRPTPTVSSLAVVGGVITTTSDVAELTLGGQQKKLDDARRLDDAEPTFDGGDCPPDPFGTIPLACPFGPEPIAAERLGALTLLAGNFQFPSLGAFSGSSLIQAFSLSVPRPPTAGEEADSASIVVPFLLTEPGLGSELPLEGDPVTFYGALATGLDLGDLTDDLETTGVPRVTVETLVPGVPGTVAVGLGIAFDASGTNVWNVRWAYPGAVAAGSLLDATDTIDPDLFLRIELRDGAGARSGQRPRKEGLGDLVVPFSTFAPPVPVVTSPAALSTVSTAAFEVEFANAFPDIAGEPGLYVVRLVDLDGRGWDLYRADPPDGAPAAVHVPDLLGLGGVGTRLASGAMLATVEGYAWPGFDAGDFLLSDVAREHDLFAVSAPTPFTYGP